MILGQTEDHHQEVVVGVVAVVVAVVGEVGEEVALREGHHLEVEAAVEGVVVEAEEVEGVAEVEEGDLRWLYCSACLHKFSLGFTYIEILRGSPLHYTIWSFNYN